ncbi:MAG: Gfo/Idh/MocA family oxidoreductase [Bacteroidota bacterium]|nr:Gfo/Idh/MocA family oxidoreductase [Bacteroidota bacterium]
MNKIKILIFCLFVTNCTIMAQVNTAVKKPLRVGIVGLVHTHVHGILGREKLGDIEIVGIAEPNHNLALAYSKQHGYSMNIVYNTMEEMIQKTKPDAVLAFNTIYDHLKTVEYCAPKGIDVMVEKPLAVNMEAANKMLALAEKYKIHLLTNYETTWYGSNKAAWEIVNEKKEIGNITKIVFHTGHQGPIEIGCNPEFLEWLTDPKLDGGGALTDFGCYGANISTWLMKGEHPETVTAITQHLKPNLYPKVEDEATIILTYKKSQVIIEASWNWPFSRKDMEVYGKDGYVFCLDGQNMLLMKNNQRQKDTTKAAPLPDGRRDPFMYFANVINGNIKMDKYDLSAPANNKIVMQILEAAKQSARTGRTIVWKDFYKE